MFIQIIEIFAYNLEPVISYLLREGNTPWNKSVELK